MEKDIKNILGPKIKIYRTKLGMSQNYLIARLNILGISMDQTILSRIENQKREIYDYEIFAIVRAFDIEYNELFNGISKL